MGRWVRLRADWKNTENRAHQSCCLHSAYNSSRLGAVVAKLVACIRPKRFVTVTTWSCTSDHSYSQVRLERVRIAKQATIFGKRASKALPFQKKKKKCGRSSLFSHGERSLAAQSSHRVSLWMGWAFFAQSCTFIMRIIRGWVSGFQKNP